MDFQQWRSNHQKLSDQSPDSAALPLFFPEPNKGFIGSNPNRFPCVLDRSFMHFWEMFLLFISSSILWVFLGLGGCFSFAQWQELELQALIYKYMMAGASVPLELILPLKRSLLASSPYYHQNSLLYQHLQPAMMHSGYWGRYVTDPEPGRCRRTDGKKWRCSRDVVTGQKYCERHVHRGRNRSRKLVEVPKPTTDSGSKSMALPSFLMTNKDTNFMLTEPLPALGILPLDQRPLCNKDMEGCSVGGLCSSLTEKKEMQGGRPDGRILRRFFDDWPRSEQESNTNLSISIPGDSSSDYSLKLSTGIGRNKDGDGRVVLHAGNWSGWGSQGGEAAMGGPLAEALRSSTASTPSPTSVLRKLNGSLSETSSSSA